MPKQPQINATQLELLDDIEVRKPSPNEIWYGHSILTSTLFPAVAPKPGTDFVSKTNRNIEYMLEAGVDGITRSREFPSGKYPRLIMAWIAKQIRAAGNNKTRYVNPEKHTITIPTIYTLCDEMGLGHGGKTAERVQTQLRRLLSCRISIRRHGGYLGTRITDTAYLPLVEAVSTIDKENAGYSGAMFKLTDEVYNRLARESAPFDTRATTFLLRGRSVMPYDVYLWITGSMKNLRHPLTIDWVWLHSQFGDSIKDMNEFKRQFKQALKKIQIVYPALHVEVLRGNGGIILYPSPTAIEKR